jgi:hypothetical protein
MELITLAICLDEKSFFDVISQAHQKNQRLIVASDDICVHSHSDKYKKIVFVYLSQMEPFFNVSKDVLILLNEVNLWLKKIEAKIGFKTNIAYWVQHVEGGETTQRIQDAIILVNSVNILLKNFKPSRLIIGITKRPYWENIVIKNIANSRGIIVIDHSLYLSTFCLSKIWHDIRPIAKEIYLSLNVIQSIFLRKNKSLRSAASMKEYVAIQLCSSSSKHLNHTLPLVDSFKEIGIGVLIFTFNMGRSVELIRKKGYEVLELEALVTVPILLKSWWTSVLGYSYAKKNYKLFLSDINKSEYIPYIREVLYISATRFFLDQMASRFRLFNASQIFFQKYPSKAVRFWTTILQEGVISFKGLIAAGIPPQILFWHPSWPYNLEEPYFSSEIPIDIFFCISEKHREILGRALANNAQLFVAGSAWLRLAKNYADKHTKNASREALNIPLHSKLVLLLDSQYVLPGYTSLREQLMLVEAVVEFAERIPECYVLVKPHNGDKSQVLHEKFKGRGCGRVLWFSPEHPIYELLNSADLLITKYSTLAAEAMLFKLPSICAIFDRDKRWRMYGDAVNYCDTVGELIALLETLTSQEDFQKWRNMLLQKQIEYLEDYLPEIKYDRNTYIASIINEAINRGKV